MPTPIPAATPLREVAGLFAISGASSLPVVDADQRYLGVLNAHEIMDAVAAGEDTDLASLCTPVSPAAATETLGSALRRLDHGADAVPVTDAHDVLVGWIRHSDVLALLSRRAPDPAPAAAIS